VAALVIIALLLACLGAGRLILASGGDCARPLFDGVAGLTGLALLTGLAGWLVLAGSYSAAAGWVLLALGSGALIVDLFRVRSQAAVTARASGGAPVGAWMLGLLSLSLAMGRVLGELAVPVFNVNDDLPGYWHFPRMLLESGGFIEPFNARRLVTLGATPFVQSFFWKDFGIAAAGMADAVLGQFVIWAAARAIPNALSTRPAPAWLGEAFGLAGLLVSLTLMRENAMPALLPMGGVLVLILLTRRMTESATTISGPAAGLRAALAWGLVAAWIISLRISNAPFPAMLWLVGALAAILHRNQQQGLRLAAAALATLVGLLPWSLALWRSSGTPLFPLLAGNYHGDGGVPAPLDYSVLFPFVGDVLWTNHVWLLVIIGGMAALRPGVRLLALQIVAGLVALAVVTAVMSDSGQTVDSFSIHRYSAPFFAASIVVLAGPILVTLSPSSDAQPAQRRPLRPVVLIIALALWLLIPVPLRQSNDATYWISNAALIEDVTARSVRSGADAWAAGLTARKWPGQGAYEEAQALLPADARLVSAAETPFFFRFDRQIVHTLDIPGLVSPPPGMPSFDDPEQIAAYLRSLGYTHLAYTPLRAATGLYSSGQWLNLNEHGTRSERNWARYMLTFLQNEDRLARSYTATYQSPDLVVIDLKSPL